LLSCVQSLAPVLIRILGHKKKLAVCCTEKNFKLGQAENSRPNQN
jgi:hypothetical protein